MSWQSGDIESAVGDYYAAKLEAHGTTPMGVDWNSIEAQTTRFDQLTTVLQPDVTPFSIVDVGCGYGALIDHLTMRFEFFSYVGFDISPAMVNSARQRYDKRTDVRFVEDRSDVPASDFVIASGIFNVRLTFTDDRWRDYVLETMDWMWDRAERGMSMNFLTSYSDSERMRADLYYADPLQFFDLSKRRFSREVAILHDYGLYEFTLVVRR